MLSLKYLFSLFIFLSIPHLWAGGVAIGNGGDIIECTQSSENELAGAYNLDYILTLPVAKGDTELEEIKTWQNSIERIKNILLQKVPSLVTSFDDFSKNIYNKSNSENRVWEPSPFGLVPLDDERIATLIPINCKNQGKNLITQAIIRSTQYSDNSKNMQIIYKYDATTLQKLELQKPMQLSFLLVHEWLWDISNNVERNRRINRFLHTKKIQTMSAAEVENNLKAMGLAIPDSPNNAFDSSQWLGYPFDPIRNRNQLYVPNTRLDFHQRQQTINCPAGSINCNPNWIESNNSLWHYRANIITCLSSIQNCDEAYPILLYFGDLDDLTSIVEIVRCKYISSVENNLNCEIFNPGIISVLSPSNSESQSLPMIISAQLNEDSFRMDFKGMEKSIVIGGQTRTEMIQIESVLTARFKLKTIGN